MILKTKKDNINNNSYEFIALYEYINKALLNKMLNQNMSNHDFLLQPYF